MMRSGLLLVLAALPLVATQAAAQDATAASVAVAADSLRPAGEGGQGQRRRSPAHLLLITGGGASAETGSWLGQTPDRNVFIAAVRPVWRLLDSERVSLFYFTELVPLAIVSSNPTRTLDVGVCARDYPEWRERGTVPIVEYFASCTLEAHSSYGAGVAPLGVAVRIASARGLAFVTEASGGAIIFDKRTPYPNTTKLNYTLTFGTAIEIPVTSGSFLSVGYRMHHFSNGGTGEFNPGIAAHTLQLAWGRRVGG